MAQNARVLLVDADEQVRASLCSALLNRDVFEQLGQRRYALMLLQLEIPGVEDVLDHVHSLPDRPRPMVIMTADVRSSKDTIDTEIVQIIIRRPLKIAEVAGMIRACLGFVPDG
jgi:hypothetical protein